MKNNKDNVYDCTSNNFDGYIWLEKRPTPSNESPSIAIQFQHHRRHESGGQLGVQMAAHQSFHQRHLRDIRVGPSSQGHHSGYEEPRHSVSSPGHQPAIESLPRSVHLLYNQQWLQTRESAILYKIIHMLRFIRKWNTRPKIVLYRLHFTAV